VDLGPTTARLNDTLLEGNERFWCHWVWTVKHSDERFSGAVVLLVTLSPRLPSDALHHRELL
jgi:hypothetical protein